MMTSALLSLILAAQLMCSPSPSTQNVPPESGQSRLWWGLIDPEMSLWFSRLPMDEEEDAPVLWDFSFRGFLAALFGTPLLTEEVPDAARA